ncbi:MAG: Hsp33 family molecular chaperone HslO, partial [Planctomycetes bacterium]|nr:Hsp33 family molecular chaperone HslO [Planctomycetota bacterium]
SGGAVRGYASYAASAFAAGADEIPATVPHLLGAGHLAFTVDQGAGAERYQGITDIEGATIAECAQSYFRQSEQLETAIMLAAQPSERCFFPNRRELLGEQ